MRSGTSGAEATLEIDSSHAVFGVVESLNGATCAGEIGADGRSCGGGRAEFAVAVGKLHSGLLGEVGTDHFLRAAEVGHFPIPQDGFAAGVEHIGLEGGREPLLLEFGEVAFGAGCPEFGAGEEGLAVVVGGGVATVGAGDVSHFYVVAAGAWGEEDGAAVLPIHEFGDHGGPAVDRFPAVDACGHSGAWHGVLRFLPRNRVLAFVAIGVEIKDDENRTDVGETDGFEGVGADATERGNGEGDEDADHADGDEEFDEGEGANRQNGGETTPALPGTSYV